MRMADIYASRVNMRKHAYSCYRNPTYTQCAYSCENLIYSSTIRIAIFSYLQYATNGNIRKHHIFVNYSHCDFFMFTQLAETYENTIYSSTIRIAIFSCLRNSLKHTKTRIILGTIRIFCATSGYIWTKDCR